MAVYTEVSDEALARFLADYDVGAPLSFKGIAEGVENSNYLLQTEQGAYILTLYEKRVHEKDLPFFLSLMNHLSERGIRCPTPVANRHGQTLGYLEGRTAALMSFLEGVWVRRPRPEHCRQVGETLAALHQAGQGFTLRRDNALGIHEWRALRHAAGDADRIMPRFNAELDQELDQIETLWPDDLPSGIIHADLFPDNVFFIRNVLSGVIDFYFACHDFLAYDLAICLNAWCFEEKHEFNITCARALVSGYQKRRPLEKREMEALPILCRGSAMRFLLTRLYDRLHYNDDTDALVKPKDPLEYLARVRFHRTIESVTAYGFDP